MFPSPFDQLAHTQLNTAQRACYTRLLEGLRLASRQGPSKGAEYLRTLTDPQRKVIQLLVSAANKRHMLTESDISTLRALKFQA